MGKKAIAILGGAIALALTLIAAVDALFTFQILAADGGPYMAVGIASAFAVILLPIYYAYVKREKWRINVSLVLASILFVGLAASVAVPHFSRHSVKAVMAGVSIAILPTFPMFALGPLLEVTRLPQSIRFAHSNTGRDCSRQRICATWLVGGMWRAQ